MKNQKILSKKYIYSILTILFLFIMSTLSFSNDKVTVEYFGRDDCKSCVQLKKILDEIQKDNNDVEIKEYKIDDNPNSREKFDNITTQAKLPKATPVVYIDGNIFQGVDKNKILKLLDESRNKKEEDRINLDLYIENGDYSNVSKNDNVCDLDSGTCKVPVPEYYVNIPFTSKQINVANYSLPVISMVLGTIDGFNPCAMWVLVLFLTALIAVGNKKKMFQVAGLFILAEGIMYYLILNVWMTAWDFVKLDNIITPIVGVVGIIGGVFFIRNYLKKGDELSCEITDMKKRGDISQKIINIANRPFTFITIMAIMGLALSVNVIEFACSVGIPQMFTKIIQQNNVNSFMRQIYNLIYIIGYMIDDILIFGLALVGMNKLQLTTKYSKWMNLFGGLLMIILGLILIFKPEILIFA